MKILTKKEIEKRQRDLMEAAPNPAVFEWALAMAAIEKIADSHEELRQKLIVAEEELKKNG